MKAKHGQGNILSHMLEASGTALYQQYFHLACPQFNMLAPQTQQFWKGSGSVQPSPAKLALCRVILNQGKLSWAILLGVAQGSTRSNNALPLPRKFQWLRDCLPGTGDKDPVKCFITQNVHKIKKDWKELPQNVNIGSVSMLKVGLWQTLWYIHQNSLLCFLTHS